MARLTLELTGLSSLQKLQQITDPALFRKAQKGGVSYASKAVPPAVAKGITSAYNITSARVKKDISGIRFAGDGTSATIGFSRRPPTLTQFKPNPGRRGPQKGMGRGMGWASSKPPGRPVSATIIRQKGRQTFPGAFVVNGNAGNRLVLRRTSSGDLQGVYGPSIGSIFLGQSHIGPDLRADVQRRITEQYIKGFQRVLDSAARGYGK